MLKGAGLLLFALFIDGLQAMLSLALLGIVSGVSLIPFAAVAAVPIGAVLGAIINLFLAVTMGGGLLAALALNDMFYPSKLLPAFFEIIPGMNNAPVWTIVVARCMWQKYKEEKVSHKAKEGGALDEAAAPRRFSPSTVAARLLRAPGGAAVAVAQSPEKNEGRTSVSPKSFDGIRTHTNDNRPPSRPSYVQKAA